MTTSIAFHSYKGGTGKTTIASNFAALLAKKGYSVSLLELDVYAPSLHSYFNIEPKKWINDFLYSSLNIDEVIIDVSRLFYNSDNNISNGTHSNVSSEKKMSGKLYVGFCNPKREEVSRLDSGSNEMRKKLFQKLILLREQLISNYHNDFIIIDTSPGIKHWSINALTVADLFILTLKEGDLDVEGTRRMVAELYDSFIKLGAKSLLLWNRVAGYCIPISTNKVNDGVNILSSTTKARDDNSILDLDNQKQKFEIREYDRKPVLSRDVGMNVISAIPCYCDIQFAKKEFLTVLRYPDHPFSRQIELLVESMKQATDDNVND